MNKNYSIIFFKISILVIILISIVNTQAYCTNAFNYGFMNSIVLLEKKKGNYFFPHGVGFLIYNYEYDGLATVVTCEHLLNKKSEIYVTINADSQLISYMEEQDIEEVTINGYTWKLYDDKLRLHIDLKKDTTYVTHPDTTIDLAAFPIGIGSKITTIDSTTIGITKTSYIPKSVIGKNSDVSLADEIYFIGFPFGIGTEHGISGYDNEKDMMLSTGIGMSNVLSPLIRSGIVAWLSEESNEFLLDAFSYSGNSGSPVFLKMGFVNNNKSYLVGMVYGHLGTSEENFGLARCVWVDDISIVVKMAENLILTK